MKRALMVATVASMIGQFNMNNIQLLQDMGYVVDVACDFKDRSVWTKERIDQFIQQLQKNSVRYYQIDFSRNPVRLGMHIRSYKQLMKLFNEHSYEFVHCHTPVASVISRMVAHKQRVKCIYTAHGFHFYHGAPLINWILFYPLEKFFSRWTDVLITINQEDYKRAKEKFHAKRVEYVPGVGIDLTKFNSNVNDIDEKRNELGVELDEILFLSVGELNKNKNHELVIRAIAALNNPKIRYFIVGKGDLKDYLENLICQLRLESQVRLLGYRNDVAELYQASDLFIFPSKREGLSVALMEAMASGLPCIVSDIRGNQDLIDEQGGILCSLSEEGDFISAIKTLVNEHALRERLGQYNRQKIRNFGIKKVGKKMAHIYNTAFNEKKNKKVFHFLKTGGYSGAESVVINIILAMKKYSYEGFYVSVSGTIDEILKKNHIPHIIVSKPSIHEYQRVINRYHPDIIHAHDFYNSFVLALTYNSNHALMISHLHNNPLWIRRWNIKLMIYALASIRFRYVLGVSDSVFREMCMKRLIEKKYHTIGNPINIDLIRKKADLANTEKTFDIIFLGRLSVPKNPILFLEIIQELVIKKNNLQVAMVGDGELRQKVEDKIQELNIMNNVTLYGFMKNPYGILKQSKILCMPSIWEGFGLAAVEALALQKPVVASPVGGLIDFIDDSCGKLCNSKKEFTTACLDLLSDYDLYKIKSDGAFKRAKELNNMEAYCARLDNFYQL